MKQKDELDQTESRDERATQRSSDKALEEFLRNHGSEALVSLEKHRQRTSKATSSETSDIDELTKFTSKIELASSSKLEATGTQQSFKTPSKYTGKTSPTYSEESGSSTEVPGNPEGNPTNKSVVSPASGKYSTTQERGRTLIGPQVEHATARVMYSRIIDQVIDRTTISKTRSELRKPFECLPISSLDIRAMDDIVSEAEEKIARYKSERSNIKKLKGHTDLPFNPDVVNEVMIEGIQAVNAKTAASLMDRAIFAANKMPYANFPTEGVPSNPNTNHEQTAKNRLGLLSDFVESVSTIREFASGSDERSTRKFQEETLKFEKYFSPKRLENLEKNWGITKDQSNGLLSGRVDVDSIFPAVKENISNYVGQLFYYPRLTNPHTNTKIDGRKGDWAVTQEEWNKTMARDEESKKAHKQPKYNQGALPRNNDPDIMYNVAGRHLVATFNAFRGLSRFDNKNQEEIVDDFLEKSVLSNSSLNKNQGWEGLFDAKNEEEIDLESLKGEVSKVTILDYKNRTFIAQGASLTTKIQESVVGHGIS